MSLSDHAEEQFPGGQQCQEHRFGELRIASLSFQAAFHRFEGTCPTQVDAQVILIHTLRGHQRQDDVHDTLQRVVAQEWSADFGVEGQFGTLEIGGLWAGHTPKTPPFVVPVCDRSLV